MTIQLPLHVPSASGITATPSSPCVTATNQPACPRCRESMPTGACACSLPLPPPPTARGHQLPHHTSVDSAYASASSTTSSSSSSGRGGGDGGRAKVTPWAPTATPINRPRVDGATAARARSRSRPPKSAPQQSSLTTTHQFSSLASEDSECVSRIATAHFI